MCGATCTSLRGCPPATRGGGRRQDSGGHSKSGLRWTLIRVYGSGAPGGRRHSARQGGTVGEGVQAQVALGDLVHVEGKLNVDKNWDAIEQSRELRILRISKVEDPNEELLHWAQVMELEQAYYSTAEESLDVPAGAGHDAKDGTHWEHIAAEAFFSLTIDPSSKQQFLGRRDRDPHDDLLLETLESILHLQKTSSTKEAIDITFSDHIIGAAGDAITNGEDRSINKNRRIRAMQYAFRTLRRAGLLFLEDDEADRIFAEF
ncbi:hypothetical protein GQ600_21211 [Phytophthora cactorum]|nr:hypothetical protein GQ600_21211 [Phytophthora cactorum]